MDDMMGGPRTIGDDPRRYTTPIKMRLWELADRMRGDAGKVGDGEAKALIESSADAVAGLAQAFEDYETKNEATWR